MPARSSKSTSTSASHAGINHEGINAEVAKGQWEFQIFGKGSHKAADDLWIARYLMARLCEKYEVDLQLHCKPIRGDWNGSGMHTNFSTKQLREVGGKEYFEALMEAFENNIDGHIDVYGPDNHLRLTGLHETQAIDKFSYGLSDRGARSACRSTSSRTDTEAIWKIAVPTRRPILTRLLRGFGRRFRQLQWRSRRRETPEPPGIACFKTRGKW